MAEFDLAIIGGGINGTGLARDAAGRGLRVLLVEMNDLGSGTSSASTKLIHGGLRYLERGAFRLVREALSEREVLLRMAPHVIRPMRFMLPPLRGARSPVLLRLGLFIYDMLGARKLLPASRTVDLTHHPAGQPLQRLFRDGFEYSDCWVDDSRLVVLNALDAAEHGAVIRTRTRCTRVERRENWELVLSSRGRRDTATARVLVNAAGPWIGEVADTVIRRPLAAPVRLIKGSHIVVRRRFEHDCGYLLQAADGRVVFALPFAEEFTLIGTTDENFVGDLSSLAPDPDEITYLCEAVNQYFRDKVTPDELVWSFCGRARALRRWRRQARGRHPRLRACARRDLWRGAAAHDLWRQDHHPSPAGGGGDGQNRNILRRPCRPGPPGPRCRAAILRPMDSTRWWPRRSGAGRSCPSRMRGAWCAPMAGAPSAFLGQAQSMEDLGPRLTSDLTGAEVRYMVETRMGADRRRRAVAAQQARPQGHGRGAHGDRPVHRIVERLSPRPKRSGMIYGSLPRSPQLRVPVLSYRYTFVL